MDAGGADRDPEVAEVVALLRRERPILTQDELERVQRRLWRARAPRAPRRRVSRAAFAVCLALGLLLMTAGTGVAIDRLDTAGPVTQSLHPTGAQANAAYDGLRAAEARGNLPFSGFGAIPLLGVGIVFILTGAAINRGARTD